MRFQDSAVMLISPKSISVIIKLFVLSAVCAVVIFLVERHSKIAVGRRIPSQSEVANYQRIELCSREELVRLSSSHAVAIIDVREKSYYEYGHILGAINIPGGADNPLSEAQKLELRNAPNIVIYDVGRGDGSALRFTRYLDRNGFPKASAYIGGWLDWSSNGLPVSSMPGQL